MSEITFELIDGLRVGDDVLKTVTLRELTAGDILDANEAAERLVMTPEGPELIASPTRKGSEILRRQILRIDNLNGPLDLEHLKRLSPQDLHLLQSRADTLDEAVFAEVASSGVAQRGRSETPGADPGGSAIDAGQGGGAESA